MKVTSFLKVHEVNGVAAAQINPAPGKIKISNHDTDDSFVVIEVASGEKYSVNVTDLKAAANTAGSAGPV